MLEGKKILITGLTGNLAGAIAYALAPHNETWGLARFRQKGQREYWTGNGVHTVVGDLSDDSYPGLPDDFDYVIHSAANTSPRSFADGMRDNAVGSGLLMAHCRKAKTFLHISSIGVYATHPDPAHVYSETDVTGSGRMGHYEGTKLAAEGAVHAMSRHLQLPTVIGRLGTQYGTFQTGGWAGQILRDILAGKTVLFPKKQTGIVCPISDDDVVDFIEPLLDAATVPPLTVNLAGDETITLQEIAEHFGKLAGVTPRIELTDAFDFPTLRVDNSLRQSIAGRCKVPLREGLTRMFEVIRRQV